MTIVDHGHVEPSEAAILRWCQEYLADLLDVPADSLRPDADFDRLGLDSSCAVALLMEVQERYGVELPAEALFENPTLSAVVSRLYDLLPRP
jgi:acyl carrier protein